MIIKYQKIKLQSCHNLAVNHDLFKLKQDTVERLMALNNIEYSIKLEKEEILKVSNFYNIFTYVLYLIVKLEDVPKVIKILDRDGTVGYYIDDDGDNTIIEEIEEEFGETTNDSCDPIKEYESGDSIANGNDEKVHKLGFRIVITLIYMAVFAMAIRMEAMAIVYFYEIKEYMRLSIIIFIVIIQIPIIIWAYENINKKKGK